MQQPYDICPFCRGRDRLGELSNVEAEWDLNSCHWILGSYFHKVPHLSSFSCNLSTSGLIYHSSRVPLPILVFPNCPLPYTQLDQRNCSTPTLIISQFLLKGPPRSPIINKLRFCSLTSKCPHPAASLTCPSPTYAICSSPAGLLVPPDMSSFWLLHACLPSLYLKGPFNLWVWRIPPIFKDQAQIQLLAWSFPSLLLI